MAFTIVASFVLRFGLISANQKKARQALQTQESEQARASAPIETPRENEKDIEQAADSEPTVGTQYANLTDKQMPSFRYAL